MLIKLTEKQNEYIREANKRINLKIGAVRSGKSYVDVSYTIVDNIIKGSGQDGVNLILGVSQSTIERNVLQPMREIYPSRYIGTVRGGNIARIFGEKVYCLGAEKANQVGKLQGMSVKYCYGDEVTKWNKEVFMMLLSRLDKSYSRFDAACNPEGPNHWLKLFLDEKQSNMYIQQYNIWDNPHLPSNFVEELCEEYAGTAYYGRYILGEWTRAEGLIYPMYESAIVDDIPTEYSDFSMSIDYGTQNAFAAIIWGKSKDTWYAIDEYYYSGRDTGAQKADDDYADDLDKFTAWLFEKDENGRYLVDGKLETIIDPSAASFVAMLRKRGRYKVRKADNDVLNGIRETATAMNLGLIKVSNKLKNWKKEFAGYTWDEKSEKEQPIKEADHLCDSTRYFVKTKHIIRKALRNRR